jgi:hypothetical protein
VTLLGDITITYTEQADAPAKLPCYLKIEFPKLDVSINQNVITEPTVVVYADEDHTQRISENFSIMYFVKGEPVNEHNVDSKTGSTVNMADGDIVSGGNLGTFDILVRAFPANEKAAKIYATTSDSYTVEVHGNRGIVNVNGTNTISGEDYKLSLYKGFPIVAPVYKIMDATGVKDITQYYEMDLSQARLEPLDGTNTDIAQTTADGKHVEGKEVGEARGRITFLPKEEYRRVYDPAVMTMKVTVLPTPEYVDPRIVLRSRELEDDGVLHFKRNNGYFNELVVRIYDNLGNDISDYYDMGPKAVTYSLQSPRTTDMELKFMTKAEADRNNSTYANDPTFHKTQEGDPIFYTYDRMGIETLKVNIYPKNGSPAAFQPLEKDVRISVDPNYPDIRFNPQKITLRKGQTWNSRGRFNITAYKDLRSYEATFNNFTYIVENSSNPGITVSNNTYYGRYLLSFTNRNASWSVTGNEVGNYTVRIRVSPSSYYDSFDEVTVEWPVEVIEKVIPTVTFSQHHIVVRKGQKIVEPVLTITDANGDDISDQYTVKYVGGNAQDNYYPNILSNTQTGIVERPSGNQRWKYSTDGKVNTGIANGIYNIHAYLVPKNPADYEYGDASYKIEIYESEWRYKINTTTGQPVYGQLEFDHGGRMTAGSIIDAIPGLGVQFGTNSRGDWEVKQDNGSSQLYAVCNTDIELDPDPNKTIQVSVMKADGTATEIKEMPYLPVSGGFYKLMPQASGFVTADVLWEAGHEYVLVKILGDKAERFSYKPAETKREMHTFANSVTGGSTCYFYDNTLNARMKVYAINFDPAYLATSLDTKAVTEAVAYLNWTKDETGTETKLMKKLGLPWLTHGTSPYVTYYMEEAGRPYTDVSTAGIYDMKQTTDGVAQGNHPSTKVEAHTSATRINGVDGTSDVKEMYIRAFGKVVSAENPDIYKLAWYDLMIGSIPAYQVPQGVTPEVQQRITSVPGITMTWGGWDRRDAIKYEYNKNGQQYDIQDSWKETTTDDYAADNGTIEGYLFTSEMGGQSNAKDEMTHLWNPDTAQAFRVPCRGDYITFKPSKAGVLYVYVLQKGCVEWNGDTQMNPGKNNVIRWRPLYILDERGQGVTLKKTSSAEDYSSVFTSGNGYATRSKVRCSWDAGTLTGSEGDKQWTLKGHGPGFDRDANTSTPIRDFTFLAENKDGMNFDRLNFLMQHWGRYEDNKTQEVIDLDEEPHYKSIGVKTGGHAIISKGFVRYTFDVLPGKTYYVFQTGSKMGFAGFAFDAQNDTQTKEITLTASTTQSFLNSTEQQTHHANVTLKGKKIAKGMWNSLVLPFSLNEEQVQETFGKGSYITVFSDVNEQAGNSGTIYFTEHRYQHVPAGLPCMVWPTFDGVQGLTVKHDDTHNADYIESITFRDVAIDATLNKPIPLRSKTTTGYTMNGIYDVSGTEIRKGDYYMSWGVLTHSSKDRQSPPYNAILSVPTAAGAKAMSMRSAMFLDTEGEDVPTAIDNIYTDNTTVSGAADSGVYNLQGQRVGNTLEGLSRGVYIVNGRKIVIR